ncbi:OLC1v1001980C1 [Oldenlandia corymbosa var. corymbosa]|uniref:OLC1v1001980C1 n=1 Tax=Oldenlandia corymbosa var. corymbosa TaxID=529605 RepID=A0AAV1D6I7_OLDCO|nr:OLC1v1001980C1 [Oldenlandia corymbosa var. corymbosa]
MERTSKLGFFVLLPLFFLASCHFSSVMAKRSNYVVHMDKSVMPKAFLSHHEWYSSILDSIQSTSFNTHIYTYDTVLHGFSALLTDQELEFLKKSPGFLTAYRDRPAEMHTTHTPDFLSLNPNSGLWPASNFGEDVIVGVIDSGVWPENPSFKDDGMTKIPSRWKGTCEAGQEFNSSLCNLKLIGARNFNKGFIAEHPNITIDMNSTRDTLGHGTHTSSTIGGNYVEGASFFGYAAGTARGIAPRARLAMYKVGSSQGVALSDILAGMDQAVADGVDIISISMAIPFSPPIYEDPISIGSFGAMEKGILVSSSAGNSGPGLGTLNNGFPWLMTVGAGNMDRWFGGTVTLGNGMDILGWSIYPVSTIVDDLPLIYNKTLSGCNSSVLLSAANGIVICDDPEMYYHGYIVSNSSVPGIIFFSDDSSMFDEGEFNFQGVAIPAKYKEAVLNYAVNDVKPTATIRFNQTFTGTKPAPAVADFSSRGPSPVYPNILKPDIFAPGALVLASWIPNAPIEAIGDRDFFSGFNILSGTSMSCPHASGIAALLKGAHPEWSPSAIRSAMMTTADTLDNTGKPIKDIGTNYNVASPLAMGAGHVNPNSALDPGLIYDATLQDYINLLCSMNLTHSQISSITRTTSYDCSSPSSDINYPSFIALYENGDTKMLSKTFKRTVTNVGNGAAKYQANVVAPKSSIIEISPSELSFQNRLETQVYYLTIKYQGDTNYTVSFGSLSWVEVGGKHNVKSPIVVSPVGFQNA